MSTNSNEQWGWENMEELLTCPVCLDIPCEAGIIEQCINGHHICDSCRIKVDNCPLCKCGFHGTRNFIAEELIRNFTVIKNIMTFNSVLTQYKPKLKTKATSTTEDKTSTAVKYNSAFDRRTVNTPQPNKGLYRCRVANCDGLLPISRLLNHIRSYHIDTLTESIVGINGYYTQTWEIPYRNKKPIYKVSRVVFISGIGTVFLNFEILRSGHLIVVVQMGMKFKSAQKFFVKLKLFSTNTYFLYNARPSSVRQNMQNIFHEKSCFTLTKEQLKAISIDKKFNCEMEISIFRAENNNQLTTPNVDEISMAAALRGSLIYEENRRKHLKNQGSAEICSTFEAKNCIQALENCKNNIFLTQDPLNNQTRSPYNNNASAINHAAKRTRVRRNRIAHDFPAHAHIPPIHDLAGQDFDIYSLPTRVPAAHVPTIRPPTTYVYPDQPPFANIRLPALDSVTPATQANQTNGNRRRRRRGGRQRNANRSTRV